MKSAEYKKPIGEKLLAPLDWVPRSLAWLTNSSPRGGGKYVLGAVACYCFCLTTETIYVAMPPTSGAENAGAVRTLTRDNGDTRTESPRFVPKPGIPDGANMKYINPFPLAGTLAKLSWNATGGNVLPFDTKFQINRRWTVWEDYNFWVAFSIALGVNLVEAKMLRKMSDSWEEKQAKFQKYNSRQLPNLNPNAVIAAKAARAELATEGVGEYAQSAAVITAVYGIEIFCFVRSLFAVNAELSILTIAIYGIINVCGFELAWNMAQGPQD